MRPITSDRDRLRKDFQSRLPKDLGESYIMSTYDWPIVFIAFYPGQRHEIQDGRIVHGSELRLVEYKSGFKSTKMLAAILGLCGKPVDLVLVALNDEGTTKADIKPYQSLIRDMFSQAVGS